MAGSTGLIPAAPTDDESDYEYEYAEETEDLYFTLDVTSHGSAGGSNTGRTATTKYSKANKTAPAPERLQILDLHSDNPLIQLGDKFYSCAWSDDLGSQIYIAKAGTVKEPRRSGYVLDVVGTSQARLTGKPVTLHRRDTQAQTKALGATATNAIILDDGNDQAVSRVAAESASSLQQPTLSNKNIRKLAAVRSRVREPAVKAQASFLERLAIIKHRKGERDAVPVYGIEELTSHESEARDSNATLNANGKRTSQMNDVAPGIEENAPAMEGTAPVSQHVPGHAAAAVHLALDGWQSKLPPQQPTTATGANKP